MRRTSAQKVATAKLTITCSAHLPLAEHCVPVVGYLVIQHIPQAQWEDITWG